MSTPLHIERVETLRQYMEYLESLMGAGDPLWFRGAGRTSHELVPSLFRHPSEHDPLKLLKLEQRILQRFRERGYPYMDQRIENEWELLFLMQHFGVPTRLLDWSENPYVALFFALTTAVFDESTGEASESPAVWVMRPEAWNKHSLSEISFDEGILSMGMSPLDSYKPTDDPQYMRMAPVALYGLHNSPRIVAQRGVFTIFGKDTSPLEKTFASGYPPDSLLKIEIGVSTVAALRDSLLSIGVTDSVIYPDLGGLAVELKRFFGYRVSHV